MEKKMEKLTLKQKEILMQMQKDSGNLKQKEI